MYAVIETGGKQYRVSEGDAIKVEKLPYEVGDQVELDRVLLVSGEDGVAVGQPLVDGAKVTARVESEGRSRKVVVWKYRPKQRYRRRRGHRQSYTQLRIEKITQ
jgi:large subunit ribosomal protein L21